MQLVQRRSRAVVDLLPIFRSEAQFRLLGELFLDPDREWSLTELAERVDALPSSISREVDRLERAGLLTSRRQGNVRLVSAQMDSTVADDLRRLLSKTYGPAPILREALAQVAGVSWAVIFGSWAARAAGEPGLPPNDIDVLVVGEVDPLEVYDVVREAAKKVGLDITPIVRTPEEWETDSTQFAETVRNGPQIDVTPGQ
jgi:DNA-binding transcriptional ArsR family regulator